MAQDQGFFGDLRDASANVLKSLMNRMGTGPKQRHGPEQRRLHQTGIVESHVGKRTASKDTQTICVSLSRPHEHKTIDSVKRVSSTKDRQHTDRPWTSPRRREISMSTRQRSGSRQSVRDDPMADPRVAEAVRQLVRRLSKRTKALDECRGLQRQVQYKRNAVVYGVASLKEPLLSLVSFLDAERIHLSEGDVDVSQPRHVGLEEIRQRILTRISYIEERSDEIRKLELSVNTAEHHVTEVESRIEEQSSVLWDLVTPGHMSLDSGPDPDTSDQEDDMTPDDSLAMPRLEAKYLDQKGEVRILEERLHNLCLDYFEEKADREWHRDQDREVEPTDDVFEQQYAAEINACEAQVQLARDRARELEEECRQAGLDVVKPASGPSIGSPDSAEGDDARQPPSGGQGNPNGSSTSILDDTQISDHHPHPEPSRAGSALSINPHLNDSKILEWNDGSDVAERHPDPKATQDDPAG